MLGCGTYASVQDITNQYNDSGMRGAFSCNAESYAWVRKEVSCILMMSEDREEIWVTAVRTRLCTCLAL
jgi:hypothetical protein